MKHTTRLFIGALFLFSTMAFTQVSQGDTAHYKIDKDPLRTMKMIKSGTVDATVGNDVATTEGAEAVEVEIAYDFNLGILGNQDGSKTKVVEKEFFTEEFLVNLRKTKHFESPNFKADHLGFGDAKNMDGKLYPNCDKIRLYDMKDIDGKSTVFTDLFAALTGSRAEIEDMVAIAHVYPGVPVLGAVKIDITGKSSGMNIKAGVDYMPAAQ